MSFWLFSSHFWQPRLHQPTGWHDPIFHSYLLWAGVIFWIAQYGNQRPLIFAPAHGALGQLHGATFRSGADRRLRPG